MSSGATLQTITCDGYVFYMSDGSRFPRVDVEPVRMHVVPLSNRSARLSVAPPTACDLKRKHCEDQESAEFDFHMCEDACVASSESFNVAIGCNTWHRLSATQRGVLKSVQDRLDADRRAKTRYPLTCVVLEGPGGCGKTRLMAHIMNHRQLNTLVLYVTKQNKRVQDFIHVDCLNGESDVSLQKPIDLTTKAAVEIRRILRNCVGRFALTVEKLVMALSGLPPNTFHTGVTRATIEFDGRIFDGPGRKENATRCSVSPRNVIVLLDEYTMLQPPLIHALVYSTAVRSQFSPLLLLMGGDKLQCGPVGWKDDRVHEPISDDHFSSDVRVEILKKLNYTALELTMENLQRCEGDPALAACITRLRSICENKVAQFQKKTVNLVMARYSVESGVKLYRKETRPDGLIVIRRVVPAFLDTAECQDEEARTGGGDQSTLEEFDERGVEFDLAPNSPFKPVYDLSPLVRHFTKLYLELAEVRLTRAENETAVWPTIISRYVASVRHLFPVIIVLTNVSCNTYAENFLLALSTKVRERVLATPRPLYLASKIGSRDAWLEHLERTLKRLVRCLTIGEDNPFDRQTLFVGMIYRMTATFNTTASLSLCNGETVVLTSISFVDDDEYGGGALSCMDAVTLRKLDRDVEVDFRLVTGNDRNRMTNSSKTGVMPFVPYISENIYQMQGNTMPRESKTFVDLSDVSCNSAYVAMTRFQSSASIEGIVISE